MPSLAEVAHEFLSENYKLIAVSDYSDFPKEVQTIEKLGPYHKINLERLIFLKPDLVLV